MKIFLDANILYSASRPKSLMADFVHYLIKHFKCLTNNYAIEEARRNIEINEKQNLSNLSKLVASLNLIKELAPLPNINLKQKDHPIICGAIAGKCSHLLTSDRKDFGIFFNKTINTVKIVSPQLFAEELKLHKKK